MFAQLHLLSVFPQLPWGKWDFKRQHLKTTKKVLVVCWQYITTSNQWHLQKCQWTVAYSYQTGTARPGSNTTGVCVCVFAGVRQLKITTALSGSLLLFFFFSKCSNTQFDSQHGSCVCLDGNHPEAPHTVCGRQTDPVCRYSAHSQGPVTYGSVLRVSVRLLHMSLYLIWINHCVRQPVHFNNSIFMVSLTLPSSHNCI